MFNSPIFYGIFIKQEIAWAEASGLMQKTYLNSTLIFIIGSGEKNLHSMPGDLDFHGINTDHTWYIG